MGGVVLSFLVKVQFTKNRLLKRNDSVKFRKRPPYSCLFSRDACIAIFGFGTLNSGNHGTDYLA